MSTKMAEADWSVALEAFRASLPRRGDKGRDDRLSKAGVFETFFDHLAALPSLVSISIWGAVVSTLCRESASANLPRGAGMKSSNDASETLTAGENSGNWRRIGTNSSPCAIS